MDLNPALSKRTMKRTREPEQKGADSDRSDSQERRKEPHGDQWDRWSRIIGHVSWKSPSEGARLGSGNHPSGKNSVSTPTGHQEHHSQLHCLWRTFCLTSSLVSLLSSKSRGSGVQKELETQVGMEEAGRQSREAKSRPNSGLGHRTGHVGF